MDRMNVFRNIILTIVLLGLVSCMVDRPTLVIFRKKAFKEMPCCQAKYQTDNHYFRCTGIGSFYRKSIAGIKAQCSARDNMQMIMRQYMDSLTGKYLTKIDSSERKEQSELLCRVQQEAIIRVTEYPKVICEKYIHPNGYTCVVCVEVPKSHLHFEVMRMIERNSKKVRQKIHYEYLRSLLLVHP